MLNDRLKKLRLSKGLTLQQVGDHFGISVASVANWENGKSQPDSRKLSRLALLFDCSVSFLLEGNEQTSISNEVLSYQSVPFIPWSEIGKPMTLESTKIYAAPLHTKLSESGFATRYTGSFEFSWTQGPIPAGALLFVEPEKAINSDSLVLVQDSKHALCFAKVQNQNKSSDPFFISINLPRTIFNSKDLKIIGSLVEWRISGVL